MRLVYFGTSAFAVPALERLAPHVALVVTQPDRPSGRGMETRPSHVKQAAQRLGLRVKTPEKLKPEVESLRALAADAFVVASYGKILRPEVLAIPRCGCVNLHASLLPAYRGAAPIQYAVLNGERETGVTVMLMDEGMDSGDLVAARATPIGQDETAGELHDRLALLAADMAEEWVPRVVQGDFPRAIQDGFRATFAPKVSRQDAKLSFDRPAQKEYDRFRAFTPAPGAWVETAHGPLKLRAVRRPGAPGSAQTGASPGTVVATNPFEVAFSTGSLVFETVQPEGRKAVPGPDFANGARLSVGDCLKP